MKSLKINFKSLLAVVIVFVSLVSMSDALKTHTQTQAKLRSQLKTASATKNGKTETVMGFFNDMYMEEKASNLNTNSQDSNSTDSSEASDAGNSNSSDGLVADWLQISSPSLKNKKKYPPIVMPDGSEIDIKIDRNNFRINDAYKVNNSDPDGPPSRRHFWFRLSGTHVYYSMSKTGVSVIGAIAVSEILDAKPSEDQTKFCFDIDDEEKSHWTLCADSEDIRTKWICQIKTNLGKTLPSECGEAQMGNLLANVTIHKTIIEEKTVQPIILIPLPSKNCNDKWSYNNLGSDWECMCSEGKEQSPIDLPGKDKAFSSPVTPLFQYEEVQAKSPLTTLDGQVKTNEFIKIKYFDNALRIMHPNFGKIVTLDEAVYVAEEIVFHTPSEHTIEGKRFDMEMQIIHYGQSKGDIAKQVILSFLFKKKAGVYNKFIDDVDFFGLPNPLFKEREITNNLFIPKVLYSASDEDIPVLKPFSFYTYQGSVTFPPCTERTIHYVAADPIPIASAPLEMFKEALKQPDLKDKKGNIIFNAEDPVNYRLTQPLNDRAVFLFDHEKYCESDAALPISMPEKPTGHYEKVPKKMIQYYFVAGDKPSGMPGSFVVDEAEGLGLSKESQE